MRLPYSHTLQTKIRFKERIWFVIFSLRTSTVVIINRAITVVVAENY